MVLGLKRLLQVSNHLLLDLLKLLDAHFVEFASTRSLDCHLIVVVRDRMVISVPAIFRVLSRVVAVLQRLVGLENALVLFLIFLAEALVLDILTLHLDVLAGA